jgi:hypothetical protein
MEVVLALLALFGGLAVIGVFVLWAVESIYD